MSGSDDDLPDYLKGVQPGGGFDDRDNVTIRPDRESDLGRGPARSPKVVVDDDDDDDDEVEPRPPFPVPPQVILLGVLGIIAVCLFLCAGVAAYGTWIGDDERATLAAGGVLARTVDEERKIIDELGSRGANRADLIAQFADIDRADGQRRGQEALEFARLVDREIVAIGDIRGTVLDDRQKKIRLAQDQYEAALSGWRSKAGNPIGRLACGIGIATPPP